MIALLPILALTAVQTPVQTPVQKPASQPQGPKPPPGRVESTDHFDRPFSYRKQNKSYELAGSWLDLVNDLERMRSTYESAKEPSFDEAGQPDCEHAWFRETAKGLATRLADYRAGYVGSLFYDSDSDSQRRAAWFGALFVPDLQKRLSYLAYLPHESNAATRRRMIELAMPTLARLLPKRGVTIPNDPRIAKLRLTAEHAKRLFTYRFDASPWIDLCRAPKATDRALGLRVLTLVARARPETAREAARVGSAWLADNLRSTRPDLANAARSFVTALMPGKELPARADEAVATFRAHMRELFPDIRLSGGICELFEGPDRERLVEVGRKLLRSGEMAFAAERDISDRRGTRVLRGIRLENLPEPLDELGLEVGDLVVALNGTPTLSCAVLLRAVQEQIEAGTRSLTLEWVDARGKERARRYLIRGKG